MSSYGVMTGFKATRVSSGLAAGTVVKAAPSVVGTIIVGAASGAEIGIYDSASTTANLVASIVADGAISYSAWLGIHMENGVFVKTISGSPTYITILWQ